MDCAWLIYHPALSFKMFSGTIFPSDDARVSHHWAVRALSFANANDEIFSSVLLDFFPSSNLVCAVVILDSAAPTASTSVTPYNLKLLRSSSDWFICFSTLSTRSLRYFSLSSALPYPSFHCAIRMFIIELKYNEVAA